MTGYDQITQALDRSMRSLESLKDEAETVARKVFDGLRKHLGAPNGTITTEPLTLVPASSSFETAFKLVVLAGVLRVGIELRRQSDGVQWGVSIGDASATLNPNMDPLQDLVRKVAESIAQTLSRADPEFLVGGAKRGRLSFKPGVQRGKGSDAPGARSR